MFEENGAKVYTFTVEDPYIIVGDYQIRRFYVTEILNVRDKRVTGRRALYMVFGLKKSGSKFPPVYSDFWEAVEIVERELYLDTFKEPKEGSACLQRDPRK